MMKNSIVFLALALVGFGCQKPAEDACMTIDKYIIRGNPTTFTDCSGGEYILWEFSDTTGYDGLNVTRFFRYPGMHSVKQTVYSEDGRATSTATETFLVGNVYFDSIYFERILVSNFPDPEGGDRADIYAKLNGERSNETYQDYFPGTQRVSFTFPTRVEQGQIELFDANSTGVDVLIDVMEYEVTDYNKVGNPFFAQEDGKYDYYIFWTFAE